MIFLKKEEDSQTKIESNRKKGGNDLIPDAKKGQLISTIIKNRIYSDKGHYFCHNFYFVITPYNVIQRQRQLSYYYCLHLTSYISTERVLHSCKVTLTVTRHFDKLCHQCPQFDYSFNFRWPKVKLSLSCLVSIER